MCNFLFTQWAGIFNFLLETMKHFHISLYSLEPADCCAQLLSTVASLKSCKAQHPQLHHSSVPSPFEKVIPLLGSGSTFLCSCFMSRGYLEKNSPVFLLGRLGNVSSFKYDLQLVVEKQNTADNEMLLNAVFQLSRELVLNLK